MDLIKKKIICRIKCPRLDLCATGFRYTTFTVNSRPIAVCPAPHVELLRTSSQHHRHRRLAPTCGAPVYVFPADIHRLITSMIQLPSEPLEPLLHRLFIIPCGLLLLFFGVFLLRPTLVLVSSAFVGHYVYSTTLYYLFQSHVHFPQLAALIFSLFSTAFTFCLVFWFCDQRSTTGFVLGICIAMSLLPISAFAFVLQRLAAVIILATAFALLMTAAEKQVSVFVTAYSGSFLVWHALELIDTESIEDPFDTVPSFLNAGNDIDIWFSVMSFLVIGCLGCMVQLILLGGNTSRIHYQPIQ